MTSFKEEWVVKIDREAVILNEEEVALLKEAILRGERGILWFADKAISIPHIQLIYQASRKPKLRLEEGEFKPLMSKEKSQERLQELIAKAKSLKGDPENN